MQRIKQGFCGFAEHFAKSDATFREAAATVLLTERFFHKLRRGSPAAPPFACQKGGIPVLSASGFLMPIPRKSFGQSRWGFQWIAASAFQAKGSLCFKWNFLDGCFLRSTGDLHYTSASASCRMGNPCFGSPAWWVPHDALRLGAVCAQPLFSIDSFVPEQGP